MKATFNRRTCVAVGAIALLPLAAVTFFKPSYQTNNDIAMRLLAEGHFVPGNEPLPYLMFINVILGRILSLIYEVTPTVPWYDLMLGGSLLTASAALVYCWVGGEVPSAVIWALLFAAYFLFPAFVSVEFSLAGMACAAAGVALIARVCVTDMPKRQERVHLLLGMSFFFWGSLIRFEGACVIAVEGALLLLPLFLARLRSTQHLLRRVVPTLCIAFLLTMAGFAVNRIVYQNAKGWDTFYEYNRLRARLGEYMSNAQMTSETTDRLKKEVGWSPNDFKLFRNWFFTDPEVFSLARVRLAVNMFYDASGQASKDWKKERFKQSVAVGAAFFKEARWGLLFMGVFVLGHGFRPRLLMYFVYSGVILASFTAVIALASKAPPQRILWPMLIMSATMLTIAAARWEQRAHWSVSTSSILLSLVLVALAMPALKTESDRRSLASKVARADVEGLRRTGAQLFILHGAAFPYEDFWTPLHIQPSAFDFVGLGASARTPPVQDYLAKTGHTDLPWSLCTNPSMLLISAGHAPPMLVKFVEEHRGAKVRFDKAFEGGRIVAWKCRRL